MEHKQKTFTFVTKNKKQVTLTSRKYTFEIEEVLVKRFGKDKLDKIFADQSVEFNFTLKDVEEDFPKLLLLPSKTSIDYKTQDFDELLKVYAFFLLYKKNATLRELEFNNETLALAIQQAREVLALMPELISLKKS